MLTNLETNRVSLLIEKLIPGYIRDSYPNYVTFIVKYYEYLDRIDKYSDAIVFSSSNVKSWIESDSKIQENVNSLTKGFAVWIAVGDNGTVSESYDGSIWSENIKFTKKNIVRVVHNSKYFIAITQATFDVGGNVISPSEIWIRPNDPTETANNVLKWQQQTVPSEFSFNDIISIEDRISPIVYVVGDQGTIYHSTDLGLTWFRNFDNYKSTSSIRSVAANVDSVMMVGAAGSGTIDGSGNLVSGSNCFSTDRGTTWVPLPTGSGGVPTIQFNDVIVENIYDTTVGQSFLTWIIVGNGGEIYYSRDPATAGSWTKGIVGTTGNIKSVIWSQLFRKFFAVGEYGLVISSIDAIKWDFEQFPTSDFLNEVYQIDNSSILICSNKQPAKDLGGEFFIVKSILALNDIDETVTVPLFLENLKKEYMDENLKSINVDLIKFIKHIKSFYKVKGTEESYRILFKALYNIDISFFYPKSKIFKLSGSEWNIPRTLFFAESADPEWWPAITLLAGQDIATNIGTSLTSSTAFVDKINIVQNPNPAAYYSGATTILGLEITAQTGVFQANDTVTSLDNQLYKNNISMSINAADTPPYVKNTHLSIKNGSFTIASWNGTGTNSNISYTVADDPLTGIINRTDSLGNIVAIGLVDYNTGVVTLNTGFYGLGSNTDFYSFNVIIDELRPPVLHLVAERFGTRFINNTLVGDNKGYYKNSNSRISDNTKIQDNNYYQIYSYEIQSEKSQSVWNNIIRNTIHPAGFKVFGKIVFKPKISSFRDLISTQSTTVTNYLLGVLNGFNPPFLDIAPAYPITRGAGINYTDSSPWNVYILNTNGMIFTGVSTSTDNYSVDLVTSQSYLNYTTRTFNIGVFQNTNYHRDFLAYQTILNSNRAFGNLYWDVINADTTGIINDYGNTVVSTANIDFSKGFPFHPSSLQHIEHISSIVIPFNYSSLAKYKVNLSQLGLNFIGVSTASETFLSNYTTRTFAVITNSSQLFDSFILKSYLAMEQAKSNNGFVQAKFNMISQVGDLPISTPTTTGQSKLFQSSNISIGTMNFIQSDNGVDDIVGELFWSTNTVNNNIDDGLNLTIDSLHPSYTAWNQFESPNTPIAPK